MISTMNHDNVMGIHNKYDYDSGSNPMKQETMMKHHNDYME